MRQAITKCPICTKKIVANIYSDRSVGIDFDFDFIETETDCTCDYGNTMVNQLINDHMVKKFGDQV